jgi:putative flippase GtrA
MENKKDFLTTIFQLIKYGIIGGVNFLIDFSVVKILSILTGINSGFPLFFFNLISFFIYSINGYFMNKKFTFKTKGDKKSYIKYASVLGIAMLANSAILITLTHNNLLISSGISNDQWLSISKLIASITTGIFSFLINKFFIFNEKQPKLN